MTEQKHRPNEGKQFEADFKASVPKDVWCYRLRDSPGTFYGGAQEGVRFSSTNICDYIVYKEPQLLLVELKTVGTTSASLSAMFGKWDASKGQYHKQRHLADMAEAAQQPGIRGLVVINYRRVNRTYSVDAAELMEYIALAADGGRKSVPESWCAEHGRMVPQRRLRVHWRYDIASLF